MFCEFIKIPLCDKSLVFFFLSCNGFSFSGSVVHVHLSGLLRHLTLAAADSETQFGFCKIQKQTDCDQLLDVKTQSSVDGAPAPGPNLHDTILIFLRNHVHFTSISNCVCGNKTRYFKWNHEVLLIVTKSKNSIRTTLFRENTENVT